MWFERRCCSRERIPVACPRHPRLPAAEACRGTKGSPFADQRRGQRTSCPGKNSCRTHKSETIREPTTPRVTPTLGSRNRWCSTPRRASQTSPDRVVSRAFAANDDRSTCSRVEFRLEQGSCDPWILFVTRTLGRSVKMDTVQFRVGEMGDKSSGASRLF